MPISIWRACACVVLTLSALSSCEAADQIEATTIERRASSPIAQSSSICTPTPGPNVVRNSDFTVLHQHFPAHWNSTGNVTAAHYARPASPGNHFARLSVAYNGANATLSQELHGLVPNATYIVNADFSVNTSINSQCSLRYAGIENSGLSFYTSVGPSKLYASFIATPGVNTLTISAECSDNQGFSGLFVARITSVSVFLPDPRCAFKLQVTSSADPSYDGQYISSYSRFITGPYELNLVFTTDATLASRFQLSDDGFLLLDYRDAEPASQGYYSFFGDNGQAVFGKQYETVWPKIEGQNWMTCEPYHAPTGAGDVRLRCRQANNKGLGLDTKWAILGGAARLALQTPTDIANHAGLPLNLTMRYSP